MNTRGVVDGYTHRAPFYASETTTSITRPACLPGLLAEARHVGELPCGAGHFLADYAAAGVKTTLIDANQAMLDTAAARARRAGLPPSCIHARARFVQQVGDALSGVDLLVVPNGALGQLACQMPIPALLDQLRRSLPAGARLLAQVLCTYPDGDTDACGFYDPRLPHHEWVTDRDFDPEHTTGLARRLRRQHRAGRRLRIEFDYHDVAGHSLETANVEMRLLDPPRLRACLAAVGFAGIDIRPGRDHLSDILATVPGARR